MQPKHPDFLESLVGFFAKRKMLANFILLAILAAGVFSFIDMPKNAWPNVDFDRMRINVSYPGATPEDVERDIIVPIEEVLIGLSGIDEVESSASPNRASISLTFDPDYPDRNELTSEIRTLVLAVRLPEDVRDEPTFFEVKTSEFSILDVGIYNTNYVILSDDARRELQLYSRALEAQLLAVPGVTRVSRSGYLNEEIRIEVDAQQAANNRVTLSDITRAIRENNSRQPAGTLSSMDESRVTISSELLSADDILNVRLSSSFSGDENLSVADVASVRSTFEETTGFQRINGYEGVYLRMTKGANADAIKVDRAMKAVIADFQATTLAGTAYELAPMDDDSADTRNRLSMISINGSIGFLLILVVLFLFLNFESGFWVALGIPFCFTFTLWVARFFDITINNMTLAAAIIVMGMVVDDAIVVSENIIRLQRSGMKRLAAAIRGASFMFIPITAAIVTTCAAFFPLLSLDGRNGKFVATMPSIIFLMLIASLLESLFLLPAHLSDKMPMWAKGLLTLGIYPLIIKIRQKKSGIVAEKDKLEEKHWFDRWERRYQRWLFRALKHRLKGIGLFVLLLIFANIVFFTQFNFVFFPNDEVTQLRFSAEAPEGSTRFETSKLMETAEAVVRKNLGTEVTAFRTVIAQGRWGNAAEEHKAQMRIEIVAKEDRALSARQLVSQWEAALSNATGFASKRFIINRQFGGDSGSSVEIEIANNSDEERETIINLLTSEMKKIEGLTNIESDRVRSRKEYVVHFKRQDMKRLQVNPESVAQTLRASLEGQVPVRLRNFDEEIDIRVVLADQSKEKIEDVLSIPVANQLGYLIPMRQLVDVQVNRSRDSIERRDFKRVVKLYASIQEDVELTPLMVASKLEANVFPKARQVSPSTRLSFDGEIRESREAQGQLWWALCIAVGFIFVIIALTFNSALKSLLIMFPIIVFAPIGILLAYTAHGMMVFGFFTCVGAIGLAGVLVNDAIIMVNKFDKDIHIKRGMSIASLLHLVSRHAKTRLKAVILTTLTTVAGLMPTAYGLGGYDPMVSEMMMAMSWGLVFGTIVTLYLIPLLFSFYFQMKLSHLNKHSGEDELVYNGGQVLKPNDKGSLLELDK